MVTAKIEEIDRLLGLEIGADDYHLQALQSAGGGRSGENHPPPL